MKAELIISLCLSAITCHAQSDMHTRKANQLYKEKKFPEALSEYQQSLKENADDPVLNYNIGDTYFRNEKFEDASRFFDKLLTEENTAAGMRQKAFYNKGVTLSQQSKLEESIEAYKNALLLDPNDSDARINLQKALLEIKKKQQPEKERQEQEKNNKQKQNEQPPPAPGSLTKKQVDQLLKALEQREQQVQQKMLRNRARGVTKPEKDW